MNHKKPNKKSKPQIVKKKVIILKCEREVYLSKNEIIAMKRILMDFIKRNKFFKKTVYNKDDSTDRYLFNQYSDVFKAYNKIMGRDENCPIYQQKLS